MRSVKPALSVPAESEFISVDAARPLLAIDGRKAARERIFALGLEGRLEVQRFASRWWVSRRSIDALRAELGTA